MKDQEKGNGTTGNTNGTAVQNYESKNNWFIPTAHAMDMLESAEVGLSLSKDYRKVEDWLKYENTPIRCYFVGMDLLPNEDGELILCSVFMDKTGKWMGGQTMLVEQTKLLFDQFKVVGEDGKEALEMPIPVQILYKGSKKNKTTKGSTQIFKVNILSIPVKGGQNG